MANIRNVAALADSNTACDVGLWLLFGSGCSGLTLFKCRFVLRAWDCFAAIDLSCAQLLKSLLAQYLSPVCCAILEPHVVHSFSFGKINWMISGHASWPYCVPQPKFFVFSIWVCKVAVT